MSSSCENINWFTSNFDFLLANIHVLLWVYFYALVSVTYFLLMQRVPCLTVRWRTDALCVPKMTSEVWVLCDTRETFHERFWTNLCTNSSRGASCMRVITVQSFAHFTFAGPSSGIHLVALWALTQVSASSVDALRQRTLTVVRASAALINVCKESVNLTASTHNVHKNKGPAFVIHE